MALFSFPSLVNEKAARLVASGVVVLLSSALLFHLPWLVPLVALGFLLRVGWGPRFSPLARTAMATASRLFEERPVSGPPKRFAQAIGAFCTVSASLLLWAGLATAAWALVGLVILFALLEASIAFCMGCWIYGQLQHVGWIAPDVCVDCAPARKPAKQPAGNL
jgi:Domain of unknown function (DUF4395)